MFKFGVVLCCLMAVAWAMPAVELSQAIETPNNPAVLLVQTENDGADDLVGAETAHHGGGFGGYGGGYGGYGGGFGGYGGGYGGYGGGFGGYGGGFGGYGGGFGGYHHGHHHHHHHG
ncbi:shematrin-like protein 2 [Anopheles cruzii]|uniref:shematrin-like protein 2 n=1 Tax=Anopheles cruzii TaxID=68878 RepID=UPI0022EC662A|nr:shematrin-like protein 2 [Anopheles cruzii]